MPGFQQVLLGALDVAEHQYLLAPVVRKVRRFEPLAHANPIGYPVLLGELVAEPPCLRVQVERLHARCRHPPRQADGVVALRATDIENQGVGGLDGLLDEGLQGLLVAPEQLRDVASLGRTRQIVQPLERARHDHGAVLAQDRVLDQQAAPLGEQAEGIVELRGFVRAALGEPVQQSLPYVAVQCHRGEPAVPPEWRPSTALRFTRNPSRPQSGARFGLAAVVSARIGAECTTHRGAATGSGAGEAALAPRRRLRCEAQPRSTPRRLPNRRRSPEGMGNRNGSARHDRQTPRAHTRTGPLTEPPWYLEHWPAPFRFPTVTSTPVPPMARHLLR